MPKIIPTLCFRTQPHVAPHKAKIHTLITLGLRHRIKSLVLKARKICPCGFDSHRPLHFPRALASASQCQPT